jgi:hypothetical protein
MDHERGNDAHPYGNEDVLDQGFLFARVRQAELLSSLANLPAGTPYSNGSAQTFSELGIVIKFQANASRDNIYRMNKTSEMIVRRMILRTDNRIRQRVEGRFSRKWNAVYTG